MIARKRYFACLFVRPRGYVPGLVIAGLLAVLGCGPATPASPVRSMFGLTMGTQYSIKVAGLPDERDLERLQTEVDQRLRQINDHMSTYVPDSEVSRFNRHQDDSWFDVSDETAAVVAEALEVEAQEGIMTSDESRRRTKGGVFFYLARYRMSPDVRRLVYNRKGKLEES